MELCLAGRNKAELIDEIAVLLRSTLVTLLA